MEPGLKLRTRRPRPARRRPRLRAAAIIFLLCLASFAGGYLYSWATYSLPGTGSVPPGPGERVQVLVLGLDGEANLAKDRGETRSDVMMLLSIDPKNKKAAIISIPRDTRAYIPGHSYDKIAHANVYGGPDLAMDAVERLLDVSVHYYVRLDFRAFKRIVDILGGIEVDVPQRMYYRDPYQDLVIDLKPGRQVLNGERALEFVRYRHYPNGDLGRIEAQHVFIQALITKMLSLKGVLKLPSIAMELARYVDTNIPAGEVLRMVRLAAGLGSEDVRMATLPGTPYYSDGVSYFRADSAQARAMIDELMSGGNYRATSPSSARMTNKG